MGNNNFLRDSPSARSHCHPTPPPPITSHGENGAKNYKMHTATNCGWFPFYLANFAVVLRCVGQVNFSFIDRFCAQNLNTVRSEVLKDRALRRSFTVLHVLASKPGPASSTIKSGTLQKEETHARYEIRHSISYPPVYTAK